MKEFIIASLEVNGFHSCSSITVAQLAWHCDPKCLASAQYNASLMCKAIKFLLFIKSKNEN